jgi:hypothetical protein
MAGPVAGPPRQRSQQRWPVRSGAVPPPAEGFSTRPETDPGLSGVLVPGALVALVPGRPAGPPGGRLESCGKTQLAAYLAEKMWEAGGLDLMAWVPAASRGAILSGYVRAAAAAGFDPSGTAESVAARFASWLGSTSRPWLLVLDDLRDADDMDGLWPQGPGGRILVTAPGEEVVKGERRAQVLPVGPLSTREALNYLVGRLNADPDQRHGAIDLAGDLGCEPAALAQASAVIGSSRLSCRDYQQYFAQRREQFSRHADGEWPPAAAAVTWTLCVEQAERLSPGGSAQFLLALAALLDGHGIPGSVFTTSAACSYLPDAGGAGVRPGHERAWDAVLSLRRTGLVTIDASGPPPLIRMSPAVQAQIRAVMPDWMMDRACRAAADTLLEVWPEDEPQPWHAASLRACASSLQRAAGDRLWASEGCHPLLLRAGQSLDAARLTGPAVGYWTELAAASDRILGSDSPTTLMAGSQLARALLAAGQAAEAVAWAQWVVAGRTRMLGPDHPGTIAARVSLGHTMVSAGQPEPALSILAKAAADGERVRGADHLHTLASRDELAAAFQAAGKPADAIGQYRRVLADRERVQGPRHPDTMTTRASLAAACLADGKVKDAISHSKRTLSDREQVLGPDHLDTAAARGAAARACQAAGKMGPALQGFEQERADYDRILGPDHPRTLRCRGDLAAAYYSVGRLADATTLLRDAVTSCDQALSPADPLSQSLRKQMSDMTGT